MSEGLKGCEKPHEALLAKALAGGIEATEIRDTMRKLMPFVDDPVAISKLIKIFLRKQLEADLLEQEQSARAQESLELKPIGDEHNGDGILKHPDAKLILETLTIQTQGAYLDATHDTNSLTDSEIVEMGGEMVDAKLSGKAREHDPVISEKARTSRSFLDESADIWLRVVRSFAESAPSRNYPQEHFERVRERIETEEVSPDDAGYNFDILVRLTSDVEKIKRLIVKMIDLQHEKDVSWQKDPSMSRGKDEVWGSVLDYFEEVLDGLEQHPEIYAPSHTKAWRLAIEQVR